VNVLAELIQSFSSGAFSSTALLHGAKIITCTERELARAPELPAFPGVCRGWLVRCIRMRRGRDAGCSHFVLIRTLALSHSLALCVCMCIDCASLLGAHCDSGGALAHFANELTTCTLHTYTYIHTQCPSFQFAQGTSSADSRTTQKHL
jgi:hypothetical protein